MSIQTVHYFNLFFGAGIVLLQVLALFTVALLVFGSKENKFLDLVKKYYIEIGFFISLAGLMVSVFYSEVVGYLPCKHCWIQRIFMFPQAFIFGVAWLRRDRKVWMYSLPLLVAGLIDALYLTYIYYFKPNAGPCDASGVSCVQRLVSEFGGYITIPTLSLSGFIVLLVLLAVAHLYKKEE